jgi:uncharacterized iron-regulated membrane protein
MNVSIRKSSRVLSDKALRSLHRFAAGVISVIFVFVATTGILLGWKKNSWGYIHPDSFAGTTSDLSNWLPLDSLQTIAFRVLHDSINPDLRTDLDRIDIRPDRGMVKFVFAYHYHGIQLDGATGRVLHLERRRSDIIEDLHDMSFIDRLLGIRGEIIKLIYTSIAGLSLLLFTVTGFMIWLRRKKLIRASDKN